MELLDFFKSNFESINNNADYKIAEFSHNFYVGIDKDKNIVIVIMAKSQLGRPYNLKTKFLSLECNAKVSFSNGNQENVHILKCLVHDKKEKEIFLEVAKLFINDDYSDRYVINTFTTLQSFFSNKKDFSANELTGFYAELYTILKFHNSLNIERYWQSRDRLKFDFSFTEKIKLEIKATTKDIRQHHFLHEQLNSNYFEIFILSYKFRYDDKGLSLFDLINLVEPILINNKELYMRLIYLKKNVNIEYLKEIKYNQIYTDENMCFFNATDIPKFKEETPSGVSKAEYDCFLENVPIIETKTFLDRINSLV